MDSESPPPKRCTVRQAHERVQTKTRDANDLVALQEHNHSISESSGPGAEQMPEHFSPIFMHVKKKHGTKAAAGRILWKCNELARAYHERQGKLAPNILSKWKNRKMHLGGTLSRKVGKERKIDGRHR